MAERRKFDKAFREQTVLRILAQETTMSKMAEELGVHYTTIRDCRCQVFSYSFRAVNFYT